MTSKRNLMPTFFVERLPAVPAAGSVCLLREPRHVEQYAARTDYSTTSTVPVTTNVTRGVCSRQEGELLGGVVVIYRYGTYRSSYRDCILS
jgi:hypothetical protein